MDRPATFSAYIRPACLHKDFEIPTEKAIATGWGKTQFAGEGSDDMLKVTLELFSVKRCNDSYRNQIGRRLPNGIKDDVQVCAGSNTQEKDTCQVRKYEKNAEKVSICICSYEFGDQNGNLSVILSF